MTLPWLLRSLPRLLGAIRRADVVHTPIPGDVGTLGLLLGWALNKRLFVRHCGNWARRRTVAERVLGVFLESVAGRRTVVMATGASDDPPSRRNPTIRWIFAGTLHEEELAPLAAAAAARPLDRPRIVTVGRQEPSKGTEHLLRAVPLLRRRFPDVRVDVVGGGPNLSRLQEVARELGVEGAVVFHGHLARPDVLDVLRQGHLFCLPSASEGFPKVVAEALAAGLPVVASDLPVLRHVLRGGGGRILPRRDAAAIAEACTELLQEEDCYREAVVRALEAGRSYTVERWTAAIGQQIEEAWGPPGAGSCR